jgi:hypothetical protein
MGFLITWLHIQIFYYTKLGPIACMHMFLRWLFEGTYKVRNEIETKRNEINETETKRNETKRNQRNKTKPTKAKRNQRKQNEIENGRKNNRA